MKNSFVSIGPSIALYQVAWTNVSRVQCPSTLSRNTNSKGRLTFTVEESMEISFTMLSEDHYAMLQDGNNLFLVQREYKDSVGHIFLCSSFEPWDKLLHFEVEIWPHSFCVIHKEYTFLLCN